MIKITLPMPDKRLSANARVHWRAKSKLTKDARSRAYWGCLKNGIKIGELRSENPSEIHYEITRYAARRMDDDNVLSMCKAYRDGICDALGINDSILRIKGVNHERASIANSKIVFKLWNPETTCQT